MNLSFHVLTDAALSRGRSHNEVVRAAIAGGATVIQLREKNASTRALIEIGRELRELAHAAGVLLDEPAQRVYATTEQVGPATRTPFVLQVRDALSLNLLASLNVSTHVTALALNTNTHHLFISYLNFAGLSNAADNSVDVIDTRTLGRVGSLKVSAEPIALAVLGDRVYVANSTDINLTIVRDCALPAPPPATVTP